MIHLYFYFSSFKGLKSLEVARDSNPNYEKIMIFTINQMKILMLNKVLKIEKTKRKYKIFFCKFKIFNILN